MHYATDTTVNRRVEVSYEGAAPAIEKNSPGLTEPIVRYLCELAALKDGDRVLDIGTGTGPLVRAAGRRVAPTGHVTGVDPSTGMLDVARRLADERLAPDVAARYETLQGWDKPTRGIRSYDELPREARAYVARLEEITGVPAAIISTGSGREETILREGVLTPALQLVF